MNSVLNGVTFRLDTQSEFRDSDFISIEEYEVDKMSPELKLGIDRTAIERAWPRGAQSLHALVRVVDLQLRRAQVLLNAPIETLPDSYRLSKEVVEALAWQSGIKLTVALVLNADRARQPGKPFFKGHWVARKDFRVGKMGKQRSFPIMRWTAEDFENVRLPGDTSYWLELNVDDFNRKFDPSEEAFRICVRADVFDVLVDSQNSAPARAVTALLLSEITTDILFAALKNLPSTEELQPDGVLASILGRICKATAVTRERLLSLAQADDRATIRAFVQSALGTRRLIVGIKNIN
jgi:hypothetical protein